QADAAEQADPADRSATEALVEREDAEAHEPHGDDGTAEVHRARGNKAKRRARLAQDRRIPDVAHHASWADAGHARRADAQLTEHLGRPSCAPCWWPLMARDERVLRSHLLYLVEFQPCQVWLSSLPLESSCRIPVCRPLADMNDREASFTRCLFAAKRFDAPWAHHRRT
ncbi:unnamed protein product, partial [Prorocentrum cordatum]